MNFKRAIQVTIRALVLLFICGLLPGLSWGDMPGDIDGDGQVCMTDYRLLIAARNQPAQGPDDPRDIDGDGTITVLDARKLILLCDLPRCVCVTLPQNETPIANAGPDQEHTLAYGQTALEITLDGSASDDPDGTVSTYTWTGSPDPTDEMQPTLTLGEGTYAFALTVTDNDGAESTPDTVQIIINPPENQRPVADAGENRTLTLSPGFQSLTVTLDGRGSYDPDGHALSFEWSGDPDPNDVEQPQLTLSPGTYTFSLVVTDEPGLASAPAEVTISVEVQDTGGPPQLTVEPSQFTVTEGDTLEFGVSAIDPDGDSVTLSASPKIEHATFTAYPGAPASGTFTFTPDFTQQGIYMVAFKALDGWGNAATGTARITVINANRPPALTVPETVTVDEGGLLTIPVTAGDPDGDLLTLTAAPLPGGAIFIPATGTITFAPGFEQAGTYDITCTADDGDLSTSANVAITVNDVPGGTGDTQLVLTVDEPENPTLQTRTRITGTVNMEGETPAQGIETSLITGLLPSGGQQGETLDVTLQGQGTGDFVTHFTNGVSQADFGEGITVNSLTVTSETELIANITISPAAATGTRAISVTSGNETAISMIAFNVATGSSSLTGILVDSETGNPISGAIVAIQGTNLTTTTGADGSYSLQDIPKGLQTLTINAPDHTLILMEIDAQIGQVLNTGSVETQSTVFDPTAPPSASIHSLLARFAIQNQGQLTLEEAKNLVIDAIIFAGGDEIGALDEYGSQLNPKVTGDGLLSLTDFSVEAYAERLVIGKSLRLMDVLCGISFGFEWSEGEPPTLSEWIQSLQEVVNKAWQYPDDPDSALPIMLFNTSNVLTPDPPLISYAMHLNDFKAFLFFSSFLTGYEMFTVEGVGAPLGIGNNLATSESTEKPIMLAMAEDTTRFSSPAAHDSPGDPSNFAYYTTDDYIRGMTAVASTGMAGVILAPTVPLMMGFGDTILQGTITEQFGHFIGEHYMNTTCAPPILKDAVVFDEGTQFQTAAVRFWRSQTDPGATFDGFSGSGTYGNRRYAYHLYREEYRRGGVSLVPVSYGAWETDDTNVLLLLDPDPPIGVNHYRVVFLHGDIDVDLYSAFVQQDLSQAQLLRWAGQVVEIGTELDNVPLGPFHSMLHKSSSYLSRLSEHSIGISVPDPTVTAENPVVDLEVSADGTIFLGDRDFDQIVEVDPLGSGGRYLWTNTGFAQPGQTGLSIDPSGNLYTDNAASDSRFGGRLFRFKPNKSREYAGQINYYSSLIGQANPVSPVALTVDAAGDLYVADNFDKQVKKLSMAQAIQEIWPPNRVVGKGIGATLSSGFSSFTDMVFSGASLFVTAFDKLYLWRSGMETLSEYSHIPNARFTGLATDTRGQLYIACQGIGSPGDGTGFVIVLPSSKSFHDEEQAEPYIFLRDLTYPADIEVSSDGKALIYPESGRARAVYFGISGQLVDTHGQPLSTTGGDTFLKAYSDLGESQWTQADENGIFSIMGLLAPGQDFKGSSSKKITLAIRSGGYTEERQVTLYDQGQTLLSVPHNPYEVVIDPGSMQVAAGTISTITYSVIERGTNQDVTAEVYNDGMIELNVGDPTLVQVMSSDIGQVTFQAILEPDSSGTYLGVTLRHPASGNYLTNGIVSIYGQKYDIELKTDPCDTISPSSGVSYRECYGVPPTELTLARGRIKEFTAEVYDSLENRILDLTGLVSTGFTLQALATPGQPGFVPLEINEIAPGNINVTIPSGASDGDFHKLSWVLKRPSDNSIVGQSEPVTISVKDFSISKEVLLDTDSPGVGEEVDYVIKITNYSNSSISGEFSDVVPDILNIVATTPDMSRSGNRIEDTLTIAGDHEEIISIGCVVNSADYNHVVNAASFTYEDITKTSEARFGADVDLLRTGPAKMFVRGVTPGCKLSTCRVLDPFEPPMFVCEPPSSENSLKIVGVDKDMVTLYGTTTIEFEAMFIRGDETDTVFFTTDIDSPRIQFMNTEVNGRIAKTLLTVNDLWRDENIDPDNPPEKITIKLVTQTHGTVTFDIDVVNNLNLLRQIYLNNPGIFKFTGDSAYSYHLELLADHSQSLLNFEGGIVKYLLGRNDVTCNNYTTMLLALFNDLRHDKPRFSDSLIEDYRSTLWLFNGLDYGPIVTNGQWKNECDYLVSPLHVAVSVYPIGQFQGISSKVFDGWFHQQPMVWSYGDWYNFMSNLFNQNWEDRLVAGQNVSLPYAIEFGPQAGEWRLNYPNSNGITQL